jgi:hypothetical protein
VTAPHVALEPGVARVTDAAAVRVWQARTRRAQLSALERAIALADGNAAAETARRA